MKSLLPLVAESKTKNAESLQKLNEERQEFTQLKLRAEETLYEILQYKSIVDEGQSRLSNLQHRFPPATQEPQAVEGRMRVLSKLQSTLDTQLRLQNLRTRLENQEAKLLQQRKIIASELAEQDERFADIKEREKDMDRTSRRLETAIDKLRKRAAKFAQKSENSS
ncbi:hypothetical protein IL306_013347 [Fusarium sp. DS 682]|nr:hypothetical protein IL306_013347 [Fusarium sp. DS 682]